MSTPGVRTAAPTQQPTPPPEPQPSDDNQAALSSYVELERAADTPDDLAKWGTSAAQYEAGVVLGIYSKGGVGKTTFEATACDSEFGDPVNLINCGANPHVVKSRGNHVMVTDINRFDDLELHRQKILRTGGARHITGKESGYPFRTLCLDVVSEMHAMCLRDEYGPTTEVTWQMHSVSTAKMKQLIRNYRELATHPNFRLNVIFALWEIDEKRDVRGQKDITIADIELSGKLQASFGGMVPFLGYLYVADSTPDRVDHGDGFLRCLDFRPIDTQQVSKFGIDADDEWAKEIPLQIYDPSLASLIDTMHGKSWPTARHADPRPKFKAAATK